jgi:hypothetical protein
MIKQYCVIGKPEKAKPLAEELYSEIKEVVRYYLSYYPESKDDFEYSCNLVYYMTKTISQCGQKELADSIEKDFGEYLNLETEQVSQ